MKRLKQYKSKNYKPQADILYFGLGGLPANFIPEIKVNYNRGKLFLGKVSKSDHVAEFIRNVYQAGTIQLQEYFIVLYLNQQNEIIGYYKHSVGAINATIVDQRIVFAVALKSLATSIILAHNHP